MDSVRELAARTPEQVEVKQLAGRIVWLRENEHEWLGPAEEALVRVRELELQPAAFWSVFPGAPA